MSASKHIFKAAMAPESVWGCIGDDSPIPDPEANITGTWLPFRYDGGQLSDQAGDPALLEIEGMAPDFGGFAPEIDSLPLPGSTKQFMFRSGKLTLGLQPFSVPNFAEDVRYPSLLATPAGRLLSSFLSPRDALATRTVEVSTHDGDGVFTAAAAPADVFVGQFLGRDIGGRREASVITGVNNSEITYAPHGPVMVAEEDVRLAQVWEGTAHRPIGDSLAFKLDYLGGRDYCTGCRAESLALTLNRRRAMFAFTVDAPIIYTDRTAAAVLDGSNVKDIIREPKGRQHATFAGTKPRFGPNAYAIDDDAVIPITVAGELIYVDELSLTISTERGGRGDFDGVGLGDALTDRVTYEATLQLSRLPSAVALDALADARDNYHLITLPMAPVGAHGGALALFATLTTDLSKLDRAKPYQRIALKFRSVSGPGQVPVRIGLF